MADTLSREQREICGLFLFFELLLLLNDEQLSPQAREKFFEQLDREELVTVGPKKSNRTNVPGDG